MHMETSKDYIAPDGHVTTCCSCAECTDLINLFDRLEEICRADLVANGNLASNGVWTDPKTGESMLGVTIVDRMLSNAMAVFLVSNVDVAGLFFRHAIKLRTSVWGTAGIEHWLGPDSTTLPPQMPGETLN